MSGFHDHFSGHAADYRQYRPGYPPELFSWLAGLAPARDLAWDCATGNGQAATALAPLFRQVVATDASAEQIALAEPVKNVRYAVAPAERSPLNDRSVNLITVAQALHWLNHEQFFAEARRVAGSGGIMAAWAYDLHRVAPEIDRVLDRFQSEFVGSYWPYERGHVAAGYATIPWPFEAVPAPVFDMVCEWDLGDMLAYMSTWSATKRFVAARQCDPIEQLHAEFARAWGDPETVRPVRWTLHVRVGKMPG
ncbi:MAG: class I SAM-dependent methyltransferase [Gemmataceae bacterium]|nr:class I SAM-dependent methyltransferase [Gemmataceae bacterium]